MNNMIDMAGWIMSEHGVPDSRIKVLHKVGNDQKGNVMWLCECLCEQHKNFIAKGSNIRNGHTKSCGCVRDEMTFKSNKKYNKYDLTGEYGIGWTTNTNKEFYFDLEDYNKIKDYCWTEDSYKGYSSVKTTKNNKGIRMHQLLGFGHYDHINRNALDNRKENLRPATPQENMMNCSRRKDNSSGITGVCINKKTEKWYAQIQISGKHIRLGAFSEKNNAIIARLNAELQYFGEFAPQRHLFEQYGITTQN
jgi:hypothetical protein